MDWRRSHTHYLKETQSLATKPRTTWGFFFRIGVLEVSQSKTYSYYFQTRKPAQTGGVKLTSKKIALNIPFIFASTHCHSHMGLLYFSISNTKNIEVHLIYFYTIVI